MRELKLVPARVVGLLTASVVVAICLWSIWEGAAIVRFAIAKSESSPLERWFEVRGLAFTAREAALTPVDGSSDDKATHARRDELAQILVMEPLSSYYWVELADVRTETHDPLPEVIDALEMSFVTGPNEDYVMVQRGMFGIWVWEKLPPDERDRTAANLALSRISDEKAAWLRQTLAEKTEVVRQEIRTALQAHGFATAKLERIGL
jgi:hypothetical protein